MLSAAQLKQTQAFHIKSRNRILVRIDLRVLTLLKLESVLGEDDVHLHDVKTIKQLPTLLVNARHHQSVLN